MLIRHLFNLKKTVEEREGVNDEEEGVHVQISTRLQGGYSSGMLQVADPRPDPPGPALQT